MREAYLDYAMSVIVSRALPDARDGLKPVHRRILYAMYDMGLRSNRPYKKSARIVGEVLGKYHPHGDTAVYDAMVRMAQDFSMRYPLVDGQGNFGSIDGDGPAAMRYTEARLASIAESMLQDIEKDTVDWLPNFDDSLLEPAVLPALLPNLLVNGSSGIAVGMATNIPPHNLSEIADAVAYVIDRWDHLDEVSIEELMRIVHGPDFPTGGLILGYDGIRQAYATGKGRIVMRAVTAIEEVSGGRYRIVVHEIPYQVNKSALIERIADLVRNGRLGGISDLRDESDRSGLRIVIELKRGSVPRKVLNRLFKYTPLQTTFGVNMLALVNGEPRVLRLKDALCIYVGHRQEVLTRRTRFELSHAEERAHILEGLRIALRFLDEVIATIRASASAEEARQALITRFRLTERQAQAILDMPLRRLAALEQQKIEDEYQELLSRIAYLRDLLENPHKILALVRDGLLALRDQFADPRRTRITGEGPSDFSEEDLITQENILISITADNYIKRTAAKAYRAGNRGARGVTGMQTRDEDKLAHIFAARTLDHVLFFTNQGRVYSERAFNLPDAGRDSKGLPIVNVLNLRPEERITAAVAVPEFDQAEYITLLTERGLIKRVALSTFASVRPSGIQAIRLGKGDALGWARLTSGDAELLVVTQQGYVLRFSEGEVRVMGRTAAGVKAIQLADDDRVASLNVVQSNGDLLVVTTRGYGKRTALTTRNYPLKRRGQRGMDVLGRHRATVGQVAAALIVQPGDEAALATASGLTLRLPVAQVPRTAVNALGVRLIELADNDAVASLARLEAGGNGSGGTEKAVAASQSAAPTVPVEDVFVMLTRNNYVKRVPSRTLRAQRRGGRGGTSLQADDGNPVTGLYAACTSDYMIFFTDQGKACALRIENLPSGDREGQGLPLTGLFDLASGERVTAATVVPDFAAVSYIALLTRHGRIKRLALSELEQALASGLTVIGLDEGDEVSFAVPTKGDQDLILVTAQGRALRFAEEEVRVMGRSAAGVQAIRLQKRDWMAGLDVVEPKRDLLVLTEQGWGKRTALRAYSLKGRRSQGVYTVDVRRLAETGPIVAAYVVRVTDQLALVTESGLALRVSVREISRIGRVARGVRVVNLREGDRVTAAARIVPRSTL